MLCTLKWQTDVLTLRSSFRGDILMAKAICSFAKHVSTLGIFCEIVKQSTSAKLSKTHQGILTFQSSKKDNRFPCCGTADESQCPSAVMLCINICPHSRKLSLGNIPQKSTIFHNLFDFMLCSRQSMLLQWVITSVPKFLSWTRDFY